MPGAPTNLEARSLDGAVAATWTTPAVDAPAPTNHAYSLDDGATWQPFSPAVSAGAGRVDGLVNGELHHLRVRAVNANGASPASLAVDAVASRPKILVGAHGSGDGDEVRPYALAPTRDGGVLVVGTVQGAVAFGEGPSHDRPVQSGFVAKVAANGGWDWRSELVPGGDGASATIAATATGPDGAAVVAGWFRGALSFGSAATLDSDHAAGFVAGIDASGAWTWATAIVPATTGSVSVNAIALAADGDVLIAGSYSGVVDFGGWPTSDAAISDAFVARLGIGGGVRWLATAGASASTFVATITVDSDDAVYVAGNTAATQPFAALPVTVPAGEHHGFVAALGADGTWGWAATFGGAFVTRPGELALIGDVLVNVGVFVHSATFGPFGVRTSPTAALAASYLLSFDRAGAWLDVSIMGASNGAELFGIGARPDGGLYAAGIARGDVVLDGVAVGTAGFGPYVVAIGPDGTFTAATALHLAEGAMSDAVNVEAFTVAAGLPVVAGQLEFGAAVSDGDSVAQHVDFDSYAVDAYVWKVGLESSW